MANINDILNKLSIEEQEAVMKILKEQATSGNSNSLNQLCDADWEEVPVDIDTFLESPEYLGNSTNNGTAIYPYWRKAYRQIIDEDKIEIALSGSIGSGKACSLDSKLVGPNGYFKMRDVKVGDEVAGEDGKFHTVLGVFPQGLKPTYRVHFSDGTYVDCSDDHIWSILNKNGDMINVTTLDMMSMRTNNEKVEIPQLTAAVKFSIPQYEVEDCFTESDNGMLTVQSSLLTASISLRVDICMNTLKEIGVINLNNKSIQLTNRFVNDFKLFCDIYRSIGCIVNEISSDTVDVFVPKWLNPYDKDTDNYYLIQKWGDMRHKYVHSIEQIPDKECQCIYVDNPSHLFLTNNFTPTHNTTAAIYLMVYFFYKLMCLKNIRQYYQLEGNGPVCVAFLNNTIQLSKGVAYDKFMTTVANSPWFLERGEVRGTVNIRYKPKKNIEFIIGSSSDQIIGRDIFCLTGDTRILTEYGIEELSCIDGEYRRVYTLDDNGNVKLIDKPCRIAFTKCVNDIVVITLSDKSIIKCTGNHKLMTYDKHWEEAANLIKGDKLYNCKSELIEVENVKLLHMRYQIPVYDVLNVEPYHNFIIKSGDNYIVSHNCAIMDELNFCISGNSTIMGSNGNSRIDEFNDSYIFGFDNQTNQIVRGAHSGAKPTAYVDKYIEIQLEDDTILQCSYNHKFMLTAGTYKEARYLTVDDDLMTVNPYGYVYMTTCKVTGKHYIGQHKGKFQRWYLGSGSAITNDINKYGKSAFSVEILAWALTADELNKLENHYIHKYNANRLDNNTSVELAENGCTSLRIRSLRYVNEPKQLYDVIDAQPFNNFLVANKSGGFVVSHNSKGADIQFEKNKVLETYNACFGRIKNRFTVDGRCQGRIFMVSSKKTEYDFLNQYIEKKLSSKEDAKNLFVADAKAFEVKPKGSYSGRMFRVAVGGSNLPSKIPTDEESTEELIHQGYEVYDVPVELRGDFELDINRFIADHLGIAVSEVLKFIPYSKLEPCYKEITNPFVDEVFEANLSDSIPIKQHFRPELVPEIIYRKPLFIHLDTSGGKGDNCGISCIACMGYVHRNRYSEETGNEETTKQMLYRQVFSAGLSARKDSEISFQKIVDFLYYLKFELGWNVKAVSTDGYMGQFLRQQIASVGFPVVDYVSLDRKPDGYLTFQSILSEQRIAMIKLRLLESEIVRLERNNVTGKVDHPPIDGSKDIADSLAGALYNATLHESDLHMGGEDLIDALVEANENKKPSTLSEPAPTTTSQQIVMPQIPNNDQQFSYTDIRDGILDF